MRGEKLAMVFQDALAALNPVFTVGNQIGEAIEVHHDVKDKVGARECSTCSISSASPTPRLAPTSTHTSTRAGCASGP